MKSLITALLFLAQSGYVSIDSISPTRFAWSGPHNSICLGTQTNILAIQIGREGANGITELSRTIYKDSQVKARSADIIALLKECRQEIRPSTEVEVSDLVYRSPAAQLRQQAEKIEARDALAAKIEAMISALTNQP